MRKEVKQEGNAFLIIWHNQIWILIQVDYISQQ